MRTKLRRKSWFGPLLAVVVTVAGAAALAQTTEGPLLAKAFEVRYKPLADAADLVSPVLSADGTMTLQPRLKTMVVEDRVAVLDRVEHLLDGFDIPPRNVEVTLSLFLGTDRRPEASRQQAPGGSFSKEVRGVIESLGDFTKWTAYEPLGSRSVIGVEGGEVTANLTDDYRVVFSVESVHEGQGKVKFKSVSLQRLDYSEEGAQKVEDLYTAGMLLPVGRLHVVGAAREPKSNRALFLFVQVEAR
jgi:hypothetical protein